MNIKRLMAKFLMFISSYFPLYIMLLILHYDRYNSLSRLNVFIFLLVMATCIALSLISLIFLKISQGNKPVLIEEIERPDDTIISYMMTYIIPILTTNFLTKGEMLVNVLLFLLVGYLYIRLNLLYLNPLWSMFGYLSYRVNSDVVVVTDIQYSRLKQIKKNDIALKGFFIGNDIFVASKRNNPV